MPDFVSWTLRCPSCSSGFVVDEGVLPPPSERDSDFRPIHDRPDPLLFQIHSCPTCAYSAYRDGFETDESVDLEDLGLDPAEEALPALPRPPAPFPAVGDLPELRRFLASEDFRRGLSEPLHPYGGERALLAARMYEFLRDDPRGAAHFFIVTAWCARAASQREVELEALREAGLRLAGLIEGGTLTDQETSRLTYLAAECARQSGDFSRAVDLFSNLARRIDPDDPDDPEARLLLALAQRQGLLARTQVDLPVRLGDPSELIENAPAAPFEDARDDEDGVD